MYPSFPAPTRAKIPVREDVYKRQPVTQINFLDSYPDFTQDVTDVSRQGKIVEKEITDQNNVIWLVRIRPYFDHTHTARGCLLYTSRCV